MTQPKRLGFGYLWFSLEMLLQMHLVQLFLPLWDESGQQFPRAHYEDVESRLLGKFSGFTAYPRAPASGLWKKDDAELQHDDLVVYEVMTDELDTHWWRTLRESLESLFHQDRILVRSQTVAVI